MRIVVYDDEDFEPITVVNIPWTERDLEKRGLRVRVPLKYPAKFSMDDTVECNLPMYVEIFFEQLIRNGLTTWVAFTKTADLALLLHPDWLPGQRREVHRMQDEASAMNSLLMKILS